MLLSITKFGGIMPKIIDPALLPDAKAQTAENCRYDQGGLAPIGGGDSYTTITKSGAKTTIYKYYTGGNVYFFSWVSADGQVYVANPPDGQNSLEKVYFTVNGELRCTDNTIFDLSVVSTPTTDYPGRFILPSPPAPTGTITASCSPSGSDPTLLETRAYVYTFVNGYGNEGPPSPVSNLVDAYDGDTVALSGIDTAPDAIGDADFHDIQKVRIYRLNQNASNEADYQYVMEINIGTTSTDDTVYDVSLGEILATSEWDPAPTGITGIVVHPGGFLVGYYDNVLCFSVPGYPHAWPVSYQKSFDEDIKGLGIYGSTIIVTTKGIPQLVIGDHPSNMACEQMDMGFANVSSTGGAQCGDVYIYPSAEGLIAIGPAGRDLITKDILTYAQWKDYVPSTIKGYYWEGNYIGVYNGKSGNAAFLFDLKNHEFRDLDFYTEAAYYDKSNGDLYYLDTDHLAVKEFGRGDEYDNYLSMSYKTKLYRFPTTSLTVLKVLADEYPVTIKVTFPAVKSGATTISITQTKSVTSSTPVRLSTYLTDSMEVEISACTTQVTAIFLASTMEELPA